MLWRRHRPYFLHLTCSTQKASTKTVPVRKENLEILLGHHGEARTDVFYGDSTIQLPIVDSEETRIEFSEFIKIYDAAVDTLNEILKIEVYKLIIS